MTTIASAVIKCPVCGSHGYTLHHDVRAPLLYSCCNCLHEWEIDPAQEPLQTEPAPAEPPPALVARTNSPRPRKP